MTADHTASVGVMIAATLFAIFWIAGDDRFTLPAASQKDGRPERGSTTSSSPRIDTLTSRFKVCDGQSRVNCVVDGDTIWFKGDKIRIADIDAPEIFSPRCSNERHVGEIAWDRLLTLLNAGGFTLQSGRREIDRYGRKLRIALRAGKSLGAQLVEEGLARRWNSPSVNWCAGEIFNARGNR